MSKIKLLFISFLFISNLSAQTINISDFIKKCKENNTEMRYVKLGKDFGCGFSLECERFDIIFYRINIDKANRKIHLEGRCYTSEMLPDSLGVVDSISIGGGLYLAKTKYLNKAYREVLTAKEIKAFSDTIDLSNKFKYFPKRDGDFVIDTFFDMYSSLLFLGGYTNPIEFHIGRLLK